MFAEKQNAGYWTENSDSSQKILLTPQDPLAYVVLNVGPPAGELTIAVLDKVTGKPIQSSTVRTTQGNHTFINENLPTTTVRVRPDSDVMVQISASGYKT